MPADDYFPYHPHSLHPTLFNLFGTFNKQKLILYERWHRINNLIFIWCKYQENCFPLIGMERALFMTKTIKITIFDSGKRHTSFNTQASTYMRMSYIKSNARGAHQKDVAQHLREWCVNGNAKCLYIGESIHFQPWNNQRIHLNSW